MGRAAPAFLAVLAALLAGAVFPGAGVGAPETAPGGSVPIDDFETAKDWTVTSSPGTTAQLVWERDDAGSALRLDYDLASGSGFVILRKEVRLPLPENFAFTFRLRGEAAQRHPRVQGRRRGRQRLVAPLAEIRLPAGLAATGRAALATGARVGARRRPRVAGSGRHRDRGERRRVRSGHALDRRSGARAARAGQRGRHRPARRGVELPARVRTGPRRGCLAGDALEERAGTRSAVADPRFRPEPRVRRAHHRVGPGGLRGGLRGRGVVRRRDLAAAVPHRDGQGRPRLRLHARRRVTLRAARAGEEQSGARLRHRRHRRQAGAVLGVAERLLHLDRPRRAARTLSQVPARHPDVLDRVGRRRRQGGGPRQRGRHGRHRRRLLDRALPLPARQAPHLARRRGVAGAGGRRAADADRGLAERPAPTPGDGIRRGSARGAARSSCATGSITSPVGAVPSGFDSSWRSGPSRSCRPGSRSGCRAAWRRSASCASTGAPCGSTARVRSCP